MPNHRFNQWHNRKKDQETAVSLPYNSPMTRPTTSDPNNQTAALLPILFGAGAGSEAMQRIAAPVVGGMVSVAVLTLAVIPAAYLVWKSRGLGS